MKRTEVIQMKSIGLIGGMSWESSAAYYRLINEGIKEQLGGLHSAKCLLYSVDFAEIAALQHEERWEEAGVIVADAARQLERAGADFLILCTNTMHKLADRITGAVALPLLHIADPTGLAIQAAGLTRIGLLATGFTMEHPFYRGRLAEKYGLDVLVPETADRQIVHRIIYEELCLGVIRTESRTAYQEVMARLVERGAQGIILGCTEIGLLVGPADAAVPLFDTTRLHAAAAVNESLRKI
jgi:aspartate racemase